MNPVDYSEALRGEVERLLINLPEFMKRGELKDVTFGQPEIRGDYPDATLVVPYRIGGPHPVPFSELARLIFDGILEELPPDSAAVIVYGNVLEDLHYRHFAE